MAGILLAAALSGVSCSSPGTGDSDSDSPGNNTGTDDDSDTGGSDHSDTGGGDNSDTGAGDNASTGGHHGTCEVAPDPTNAPACSIADPALITAPDGTTLQTALVPSAYSKKDGKTAYRTFSTNPAPAFPLHTCSLNEALMPSADRMSTRQALATFVQLTDFQLADSQDPARAPHFRWGIPEAAVSGGVPEAFRNQEMMSTHVVEAMVQRANAIARGPAMGEEFDAVVVTGDQADSKATVEMKNAILLLDGSDGSSQVVTNTSAPGSSVPHYQGVQDSWAFEHRRDSKISGEVGALWWNYWHPDPGVNDRFKEEHHFPDYPDVLTAAATNFKPTGLKREGEAGGYVPWFTVYGNHDGLVLGALPVDPTHVGDSHALDLFNSIATGTVKDHGAIQLMFLHISGLLCVLDPTAACMKETFAVADTSGFVRSPYPANEERAIFLGQDFINAHFDSTTNEGHGFCGESKGVPCNSGIDNVADALLYYRFDLSPSVLGLVLDTVNPHGGGPGLNVMHGGNGSLDMDQWNWAKAQLCSAHARSDCPAACASELCGDENRLVVLFSHHTADTLDNCYSPDPQRRMDGKALVNALWEYPNAVLWVNGHTHMNRVTPRENPSGSGAGFWEVTTASHIDYPQQSRILEIVDNNPGHAGTLSIFGTVFDHAGEAAPPIKASYADSTPAELASIAREIGLNDPAIALTDPRMAINTGSGKDNNVELILKKPF